MKGTVLHHTGPNLTPLNTASPNLLFEYKAPEGANTVRCRTSLNKTGHYRTGPVATIRNVALRCCKLRNRVFEYNDKDRCRTGPNSRVLYRTPHYRTGQERTTRHRVIMNI